MVNFREGKSSEEELLFAMGEVEINIKEQHGKREEANKIGKVETVYIAGKVETMLSRLGWIHAILASGSNKSMAGRQWTEEYIHL